MIELDQYPDLALRNTENFGREKNIEHGISGLVTETGELLESNAWLRNYTGGDTNVRDEDVQNIKEELGDCYWYVAVLCAELNFDFLDLLIDTAARLESSRAVLWHQCHAGIAASKLEDIRKKFLFYKRPIDINQIFTHLREVCHHLSHISLHYGMAIDCILEANINKLKARYPANFTEEQALNRNLESERSALG